MKICEVIDVIKSQHPPLSRQDTVDVVKYGDAEKECTGVVITCYATSDVIRKAAQLGANLIVVHEPIFFNDRDEVDWLKGDPIYAAKCALLDETGVVVWRDHDHIHGGRPMKEGKPYMDGIFYGIMQELAWEKYLHKYPNMPLIYHIPETTGRELAQMFIEKLNLNGIRIVGDPDTKVKKVFICEHVNGRQMDFELMQITNSEEIDALIPLEVVDWSLSEYVRDSEQLGRPRVMLEMGHFNFEELGMKHMARWLPELLGGEIPVHYVQSGDGFGYIIR